MQPSVGKGLLALVVPVQHLACVRSFPTQPLFDGYFGALVAWEERWMGCIDSKKRMLSRMKKDNDMGLVIYFFRRGLAICVAVLKPTHCHP